MSLRIFYISIFGLVVVLLGSYYLFFGNLVIGPKYLDPKAQIVPQQGLPAALHIRSGPMLLATPTPTPKPKPAPTLAHSYGPALTGTSGTRAKPPTPLPLPTMPQVTPMPAPTYQPVTPPPIVGTPQPVTVPTFAPIATPGP